MPLPLASSAPAAAPAPTAREEWWAGVRALLPMLLGVAPFGLIYGVLAVNAGMPAWLACAMSATVFGGASQMILTQLWSAGTPALIVVFTVAMVNLRHALYSATMAPALSHLPRRWKALVAYLLTDEAFAAMTRRLTDTGERMRNRHWFFFGAGFSLWSCWQVSTLAGVLVGAQVPRDWPLDFFLPLTFIAIIVPNLKHRAHLAAALVASALAVACYGMPHKLGIMVAALGGIAAGMVLLPRTRPRKQETAA
ncbi:AzlC family ABC transporter permease [Cupriavidus plantarum]|uniref:4-azaleucine resistance transporter AzlC n=1 Tax=Cupriavidus plantarum TaxID=942865 RepID=A0A316F2D5_9BURK|nr:AzlC family ABC transporter permease [Cupriavidus plantarum]NYH97905.1 4-azaleucine resistance transporter AzlC [Cupriavidus plantarum]PWK38472.1 4-azaleucine resistance transporter AzlC [Cupriavidus plantarum]REE92118.1 4-azaleucine resistance transporter AzlC [Cupriavidus plantarum]RLK35665.1 4-azaleucine resistance transporter AzlC [Cupriavidus plantarum]CAG2127320.1 Inner membrane protein YgaZ [Cupriavidus plantarum]